MCLNASFFSVPLCYGIHGYFSDSQVPQKRRIQSSESGVFPDLNSPLKSQVFALEICHFSVLRMVVFPSRFVALESKAICFTPQIQSKSDTVLAALNSSQYLRTSSYSEMLG